MEASVDDVAVGELAAQVHRLEVESLGGRQIAGLVGAVPQDAQRIGARSGVRRGMGQCLLSQRLSLIIVPKVVQDVGYAHHRHRNCRGIATTLGLAERLPRRPECRADVAGPLQRVAFFDHCGNGGIGIHYETPYRAVVGTMNGTLVDNLAWQMLARRTENRKRDRLQPSYASSYPSWELSS